MRRPSGSKRRWLVGGLVLFEIFVLAAIVFVIARPSYGLGSVGWNWSFIGARVSENIEKELQLDGGRTSVHVVNPLGSVEIRGSSGATTLFIKGEKVGSGWTTSRAEAALRDVRIDVYEDGAEVLIEVKYPPGWSSFLGGLTGYASTNLTMTVPNQSDIEVDASVGAITLTDVAGVIAVESDMGAIEATDVRGDVSASTDMGEITINGIHGNLTAHSNMGAIEIRGAMLTDRLELTTDMGSIDFRGRPARRSALSSDMGEIRVAIPMDQAFKVDAETSMGSVDIHVPFDGVRGEELVSGIMGSGPPFGRLKLRTDMGSIEIVKEGL